MGDPDCDAAVEKLYEYLDGELDAPSMAEVQSHLTRCSPCLEAFDFQEQLRHVVKNKCSEQMPPEMKSRILDLIAGDAPPPTAG